MNGALVKLTEKSDVAYRKILEEKLLVMWDLLRSQIAKTVSIAFATAKVFCDFCFTLVLNRNHKKDSEPTLDQNFSKDLAKVPGIDNVFFEKMHTSCEKKPNGYPILSCSHSIIQGAE